MFSASSSIAGTDAEINDSPFADEVQPDTVLVINPKLGLFFNYGWNVFLSDFTKLPTTFSCCSKYEFGYGSGISFGLLYDHPISQNLWLNFRIGFNQLDGLMSSEDTTNTILNGLSQRTTFEHRLDSKIGMLNADANISYQVSERLFVNAGFKIGYLISKTFTQVEKINDPSGIALFEDTGLPYRNYFDGEIPEINPIQAFINFGISYELPLNRRKFIFIVPELNFSYGVTNLVNGINWKANMIKGGLAFKYQEPPPPPPPPPAPLAAPMPKYPEPIAPPSLSLSVSAVHIDSLNNHTKEIKLKIEDFISLNMRPLLNYIFFDNNNATIPARYNLLSNEKAANFSEEELKNMDVLPTYYHVLNIIGKRLQNFPKTEMTLIGTNSNEGDETNNIDLSRDRANNIRDYFVNIWGINPDRITVKAQNLPTEFSNSEEIGGNEENRRVEIIVNDSDITEPVFTIDTLRRIPTSTVQFIANAVSGVGIKNWKLSISQDGTVLKEFSGTGELPTSFNWVINEDSSSCPVLNGDAEYYLSVTDKLGQSISTEKYRIPIEKLSIDKKRIEGIADKEFEFYSLILFDYGKSKLGVEHKKTASFVKKRINKQSKVTIIGYTDSMGKDEINKRISYERANEFANRLKIKNASIIGKGEEEVLFNNGLPEGRFYCRTVKITIETPIEN